MSRILIIDDQDPIRRVLRDILENEKYQIDDAANGPTALQMMKEQDYDAILCDIKMPDMDGIEVLEQVKATSDTPVIMISGHGTIDTAVDAIKKGVNPGEAYEKNIGTYGRFKAEDGAVKWIDPRKE